MNKWKKELFNKRVKELENFCESLGMKKIPELTSYYQFNRVRVETWINKVFVLIPVEQMDISRYKGNDTFTINNIDELKAKIIELIEAEKAGVI